MRVRDTEGVSASPQCQGGGPEKGEAHGDCQHGLGGQAGGVGVLAHHTESKCDLAVRPDHGGGLNSGAEDAKMGFGVHWGDYRVSLGSILCGAGGGGGQEEEGGRGEEGGGGTPMRQMDSFHTSESIRHRTAVGRGQTSGKEAPRL